MSEELASDVLAASVELNQRDLAVAHRVVTMLEPRMRVALAQVIEEKMADQVAEGLVRGVKLLMIQDKEAGVGEPSLVKTFWATGYRELTKKATTETTQWVGKKMVIAVVTGVFVWCVVFLVKNGAFKIGGP